MKFDFEKTSIWRRTLAERGPEDSDSAARSRLRNAFLQTRSHVEPLVAQIGKELPQLTVHNISHLDALWEVADVVAGAEYPISPPEAFVLGMAFLLHDAATSTAAYPDGSAGLQQTVEWKDFVAQRGWGEVEIKDGSDKFKAALFEVLRLLHPKQAEKLLMQSWRDLDGKERFLLEDVELRNYYGPTIGKIAHSHWWTVEKVEATWGNSHPLALHSGLSVTENPNWRVDTLKIALLLRCSDAAHIDSRRAPDMLAALVQPLGVSRVHWHFQNRLGLPSLTNREELYWSAGQPFKAADADAWWLSHDTARMVDREIRASNRVLINNGRENFFAKGVAGTQYLQEFLQTMPVEGWYPIDVNFKVSNIADVVDRFGGTKLYGKAPWRVLRELIQNGADAIRARRLKRALPDFPGKLTVEIVDHAGSSWLEVTDTGIGMSRYVLTEVLLDFGRSLWSDMAVRQEIPGLASAGFKAVGQFGIGFLSVFMLGKEVRVTSWRDGDSEDRQSTLWIRDGTRSRPILTETELPMRLNEFGTRVSVRLDSGASSLLEREASWAGMKGLSWTLVDMVGAIAPALDIDVYVKPETGAAIKVVAANDWLSMKSTSLLKRIAPHLKVHSTELKDVIESCGKVVGRLGVGSTYSNRSLGEASCVLVHQGIHVGVASGVIGVLLAGNNEDLARSIALPICSELATSEWAKRMKDRNATKEWISRPETTPLLSLGLPATELVFGSQDGMWKSTEGMLDWLSGSEELLFITSDIEVPETISQQKFNREFSQHEHVLTLDSSFTRREIFSLGDWISRLLPHDDRKPRTALGAAIARVQNMFPDCEVDEGSFVVGEVDGEEIEARCIRISNLVTPT
ncbi:Histidine kinase-, DNA gyrase B-, and HSP90-like ATPase [Rhodoferax sp. OV413]|uniref:HD domain-containing protein n=1 Tax=Rhodoferax sp. OV413 TaxID=1855285 RepID=UPI00088F686E|nr:ATP-binding protein [Rhodoferax sp. OV413]SDO14182.1 Histidine kinase-, DNA gyrase B-, and HSP90-like ATPase [Rhodoferax sp. OV413]